MAKLHILMVTLGFLPESVGGTEFYTYRLSQALMRLGHQVSVFAALNDVSTERFKIIDASIGDLKVRKIVNSPSYARTFEDFYLSAEVDAAFQSLLAELKPDVVHFQHLAYLSARLPGIARAMNVPSVMTLHDYWFMCFRSQLLRPGYGICPGPAEGRFCASCNHESVPNPMAVPRFPLIVKTLNTPAVKRQIAAVVEKLPASVVSRARRWLFQEPRNEGRSEVENEHSVTQSTRRHEVFRRQLTYPMTVLSPSAHLKKRYENEGFRDIEVIPLGFEPIRKVAVLPFDGKVLRIAYIGNIERHKGLLILLQELGKLGDAYEISLDVRGKPKDVGYYAEAKRLAARLPQVQVKFHGTYQSDSDMASIMAGVHLTVFPSIWEENYPLVIRESLLHGVPVIASKLGGVPEVIDDGVNGFLFDPYAEGALAARLVAVFERPQLLDQIRTGARNTRIESMAEHLNKICDIYDRAVHGSDAHDALTSPMSTRSTDPERC